MLAIFYIFLLLIMADRSAMTDRLAMVDYSTYKHMNKRSYVQKGV